MSDVRTDSILGIARLPDLTAVQINQIKDSILDIDGQVRFVSFSKLLLELRSNVARDRVESIFYSLVRSGILIRKKRSKSGPAFDQYEVIKDQLSQFIENVILAKQLLSEGLNDKLSNEVEVIATLPDTLPLDKEIRDRIPSLSASLHRLITEANRKIVILNPFFEQNGFDRMGSALLAAADRKVKIYIITRDLSDHFSINFNVMKDLAKQAANKGVTENFRFFQYQLMEAGRIVLTSHAKVLLADDKSIYMGSANLTEYGMARFVETGIILRGREVAIISKILDAVLESSETTEVSFP